MREKLIEQKLVKAVKNRGGICPKLVCPEFDGMPDRLVLLPDGNGLNLQDGGNTICWFSPIWSLELYQQTNARLFRQGQTASTVVIHHIMTKGTIDIQIMQALERKDRTQTALIDAVRAQLGGEKGVFQ